MIDTTPCGDVECVSKELEQQTDRYKNEAGGVRIVRMGVVVGRRNHLMTGTGFARMESRQAFDRTQRALHLHKPFPNN